MSVCMYPQPRSYARRLVSTLVAIIGGGVAGWSTDVLRAGELTFSVFLPALALLAGVVSTWSP